MSGRPQSRGARFALALLVFFAAALLLVLGMDRELGIYDEGVILTGAMRVNAGEIPHADFYANYGPGQFYLIAGLFKLFGEYAVVERAYDLLLRAAIVAACFVLAARHARMFSALAVAALCGLWLFSLAFYGYPIIPVALLSLFAAALILPVPESRFSSWRPAAAGAVTALVALIRYDMGFILFVSLALVLALLGAFHSASLRDALSRARAPLSRYVLGTSAVFLPAAACYLAIAPIGPFIHDIFLFSIPNYARMRSLPFPGLAETIVSIDKAGVYLPILVCFATAYSLFMSAPEMRKRAFATPGADAAGERRDWLLITFGVVTAAFYLKGLVRVSVPHLLASIITSMVLLAVLVERAWSQGRAARIAVGALCILSLASPLYAAITTAQSRLAAQTTVLAKVRTVLASPDAQWCRTPPELRAIWCLLLDPDREETARFVAANATADERIFVGLTRHDKIFVNDNIIYFAAGRMPATRWHHFDSGLQTSAGIQAEIIAELQARKVRWVILESTWDGVMEPNGSARSSGVTLLDEFIRREYRLVQRYGQNYVLFRPASP